MKSFFLVISVLLLTPLLLQAEKLEKVSLQLQWLDQFQFAGYYIAKEKGFYEEVGLDVELLAFNDTLSPVDAVVSQKATYGIGRSSLIIDKSKGKDIVLMASIFQSSPVVLLATKESNITTIKDFAGKRIMMTTDAASEVAMQAMAYRNGVSIDNMILQKHSFDVDDLINKKTDLMASYLSNEPFLLQEKKVEYTIFDPKDSGFDFYSDILFTTENEVRDHRQRALDFRSASLKGWAYAFDHIDETVALILEKYNTQHKSREALTFEANTLKRLAYYDGAEIGQIDLRKIEKIYDFYNVMGLLGHKIDFDTFVLHEESGKRALLLTDEEKKYLKGKKVISVCVDPNWMPFEEIKKGKYIGMSADYMRIIESKIKTPIRLVPTKSWNESIAYVKARKCDILSLVMETPERKKYLNFTPPYLIVPLVIATTTDKFFITDLEEVSGEKVGVVKGYALAQVLKTKYPSIQLVEVENIEDGLKAVAHGELFGFIDNLTTIGYQMQKEYIGTLKIAGRIDQNWELGIGVRNDDPMLLEILNKAIGSIDDKTKQTVLNQWMSIRYDRGFDYTLLWKILGIVGVILLLIAYRYRIIKEHNNKLLALNRELETLSITDTLTKLYNRRYLDTRMQEAIDLFRRYQTPFSLVLMDIDNFKDINDTHGHAKGDVVLQKIAEILSLHSRSNDIVGRWGGEEFLIICPLSTIENARHLAEKMCEAIENEKFDPGISVTASFGVTAFTENDTGDSIIAKVDQALYRAKAEGKNRVSVS
ncbi:diguanylate cyclase [Sulfurimonas sp. HSL3-7]|uniref:diguanylate cyclase n=1 Tax=Sulfonitrofixus jiaomeiensis TaxID=3131938 RepID=UPI0031F98EA0